jgi:hypothetical protein
MHLKERTCGCGCGQSYIPSGPRQKLRRECSDRLFREKVAKRLRNVKPKETAGSPQICPATPPKESVVAATIEYTMVCSGYSSDLSTNVTELLRQGWSLYGNPLATVDHLCQAMTRPATNKPKESDV